MKMTKEHVNILKDGIDRAINNNGGVDSVITMYEQGNFPRANKVKELQQRFCFDLLYASGLRIGDGVGTRGDIEGDYSDSHIYTALKSVCPTVKRKY